MTIIERLQKAQACLEVSDDISARELVDSVLAEDPHNSVALRLDDAIVRERVSREHALRDADNADLSFTLPWPGQSIVIGIALAVLGILTLFFINNQLRMNINRPAAITSPG